MGRLRNQLTIALRHPPLLEIEVVLQADPDVASQRDRRRHEWPLAKADPDHLPVSAGRKGFHLVDECARARWDAAEDTHDEAELIGRPEHAHVDEGPGVADVTCVEALHLRPHTG